MWHPSAHPPALTGPARFLAQGSLWLIGVGVIGAVLAACFGVLDLFALSVLSLAVLAASGYLGGKLTYRYGVRVADEVTQADGYGDPHAPARPTRPGGPDPAAPA